MILNFVMHAHAGQSLTPIESQTEALYFYDAALPEVDVLLKAMPANGRAFPVSKTGDPIDEVIKIAAQFKNLKSVHFLTHGSDGKLHFPSQIIDQEALIKKGAALRALGSLLRADGGIFIYGCDVAQTAIGVDFVNKMSGLTGRAVAASSNLTGSEQRGADWALEVRAGQTQEVAFSAPSYKNLLWVTQLEMAGWFGDSPALTPNPNITADGLVRFSTIGANLTGGGGTFDIFNTGVASVQRIRNATATSLAAAQTGNFYYYSTLVPSSALIGQRISRFTFNQVSQNATAARASLILYDTVTATSQVVNAGFAIDGTATTVSVPITTAGMVPGRTYQLRVYMWNCVAAPAANTCYIDNPTFFTQFNELPVAQNDAFTTPVNTTVNGTLYANNGSGVDSDPEALTLTTIRINGSTFTVGAGIPLSGGTLTVTNATTGAFSFVPTSGFNGVQTFTYMIGDGYGGTASATVTITVGTPPRITFVKALGGNRSAATDQFTVAIRTGGVSGTVVNTTTNSTTTGATNVVTAGTGTTGVFLGNNATAYTLTESAAGTTNLTQYSGTITCTDSAGLQTGLPTGAAFSPATGFTISPVTSAVITCTLTNSRAPTISLTKALGANRVAAGDQFTVAIRTGGVAGTVVSAAGAATTTGATNVVTGGTGTTGTFTATVGTAYTLTEGASGTTNFAQYNSAITCSDSAGLQTGLPTAAAYTVASGLTITPVAGAVISCTLTNTAKNPVLTLAKSVVNTGGGTAVASSWTLQAAGPTSISGATGAVAVTGVSVAAGAYTLSETGGPAEVNGGAADYSAAAYSCVVNGGAATSGNSITLNLGDTAVCTITNTFVPDTQLTVDKRMATGTVTPLQVNQVVTYEFEVTNLGNVTISGVNVQETAFNGAGAFSSFSPANGSVSLAPGASATYTATYTVTQEDVDLLQ